MSHAGGGGAPLDRGVPPQRLTEPKVEEGTTLQTIKVEVKEEPLSDPEEPLPKYTKSSDKDRVRSTAAAAMALASSKPSTSGSADGQASSAEAAKGNSDGATGGSGESKTKEDIETEERERMQVLVSNFTEDQLDRYEMYRRAAFPKAAIKRIMQNITGSAIGQNVVIAMSGISKVFAGEVVEEALDYMDQLGESGPLKPKHLREAARRLRTRGVFPRTKKQSALRK